MTEQQAWLALNAAELSPRVARDLLDRFGSPRAILEADPTHLRLRPAALDRLRAAAHRNHTAACERLAKLGARIVTIRDAEYPANLREIPDPPVVLFVRGTLRPEDARAVALVGTRRVTPYGRVVTETLARDLAQRGVTVVSGMAVGADAAAHRGALEAGGRTLGVLACGIDIPYPRDTLELRARAVQQGAVISEVPPGTPAQKLRFYARNRLISGLSLGVVVTEAPERSGALITATFAADQGRQVFAVPGSINSEFSHGTHALLRDGARLVESVTDVLDELGAVETEAAAPAAAPASVPAAPPPADLTPDERAIAEALSLQQRHVDDIIHVCGIPSSRASAGLLMLELKGLVRRLPGNMFMRVR